MIIIGDGFDSEYILKQARKTHKEFDSLKYCQFVAELFSKPIIRKKKDLSTIKIIILTPNQQIEAEALRRRVQAILNKPPTVTKFY